MENQTEELSQDEILSRISSLEDEVAELKLLAPRVTGAEQRLQVVEDEIREYKQLLDNQTQDIATITKKQSSISTAIICVLLILGSNFNVLGDVIPHVIDLFK